MLQSGIQPEQDYCHQTNHATYSAQIHIQHPHLTKGRRWLEWHSLMLCADVFLKSFVGVLSRRFQCALITGVNEFVIDRMPAFYLAVDCSVAFVVSGDICVICFLDHFSAAALQDSSRHLVVTVPCFV